MAERNRRDRDDEFADDRLDDDETFDDTVDDDADEDEQPVSRGGTATRSRVAKAGESVPRARTETGRVGFFGRIARFFREVVAELRKVIWPTRKELLTYTAVVIVFVAVMLAIVSVLDYGFAKGVLAIFGN